MDRRRLVEVRLSPEGGQEFVGPGGLAEFQGHPGHDPLIPIPKRLAPQTHQSEDHGQQPDQQEGGDQPERRGTGAGAHGRGKRMQKSAPACRCRCPSAPPRCEEQRGAEPNTEPFGRPEIRPSRQACSPARGVHRAACDSSRSRAAGSSSPPTCSSAPGWDRRGRRERAAARS